MDPMGMLTTACFQRIHVTPRGSWAQVGIAILEELLSNPTPEASHEIGTSLGSTAR